MSQWFTPDKIPVSQGPYLVGLKGKVAYWYVSAKFDYNKLMWFRPDEDGDYRIPCNPIEWSYLP